MSTATAHTAPNETDISILQSTHMTATVRTASGSNYTVITRPSVGVVLIHDDKGWAVKGVGTVEVHNGRMYVFDAKRNVVAATTLITSIYIMSN